MQTIDRLLLVAAVLLLLASAVSLAYAHPVGAHHCHTTPEGCHD